MLRSVTLRYAALRNVTLRLPYVVLSMLLDVTECYEDIADCAKEWSSCKAILYRHGLRLAGATAAWWRQHHTNTDTPPLSYALVLTTIHVKYIKWLIQYAFTNGVGSRLSRTMRPPRSMANVTPRDREPASILLPVMRNDSQLPKRYLRKQKATAVYLATFCNV